MVTSLIRARGLTKSYRGGDVQTPVLRGVDLDISAGAFVVLLGPSGCGKTTLLNLLGALDTPDGGELQVAGVDLGRPLPREVERFRRGCVGFVFQFYNLLPTLTAEENVELVLEPLRLPARERAARTREALAQVGITHLSQRLPSQLSGGEQQRVAIARALARRPPLILADEPTGSLDRRTGREIISLLRGLCQGGHSTLVLVTHDPEIPSAGDVILRMEDGRMVPAAAGG